MAFNGSFYIKVGDYPIPLRFMAYKTYVSAPDQTQDLDSYRDGDGLMHRNVLDHTVTKLKFETPIMTNKQFRTLISNIRANMTDIIAKDVPLRYYDEWTDSYKNGNFYMPGTMEFTHFNKQIYEPTTITFIEY